MGKDTGREGVLMDTHICSFWLELLLRPHLIPPRVGYRPNVLKQRLDT